MRKNLLIACVGPTSLHKQWICGDRDFDLMIVHYGDGDSYVGDGEYYIKAKGTKFNIIGDISHKIPKEYEYIFIPDDDLAMSCQSINRLFGIARQYDLKICQPSLVGYYSIPLNLHSPGSILRYTDYVEIICPCFERSTFESCRSTFNHNSSCWGIDLLWGVVLDHPKDAIAVIDDVIAIHTRPCYQGDNYSNNNIDSPQLDLKKIIEENGLSYRRTVYKTVEKEEDYSKPSETRIYPNVDLMLQFCNQLGRKRFVDI